MARIRDLYLIVAAGLAALGLAFSVPEWSAPKWNAPGRLGAETTHELSGRLWTTREAPGAPGPPRGIRLRLASEGGSALQAGPDFGEGATSVLAPAGAALCSAETPYGIGNRPVCSTLSTGCARESDPLHPVVERTPAAVYPDAGIEAPIRSSLSPGPAVGRRRAGARWTDRQSFEGGVIVHDGTSPAGEALQ